MEMGKSRFEQVWKGTTTSWVLMVMGTIAATWANAYLPLPGISVAILGAMAAIMSLRPDMRGIEKAAWMIFISAMLCAEIRSIRSDRRATDTAQEETRRSENDRFDGIARRLEDSIRTSNSQFKSTIGHVDGVLTQTQEVAAIAKDNLKNLTGGDSAAYLSPQPPSKDGSVPLAIVNLGKYPLTGVTVVVNDITEYPFKNEPVVSVGTLAPHAVRLIDLAISPIPGTNPPGVASFQIQIYAQNGMSSELLQFRKGRRLVWDYRMTCNREVPALGTMIPHYSKPKSDIKGLTCDVGWVEDRQG